MHFPTQYSINDLEKLSGIKAHTIRIWEKRYSVIEPERTDTNIRYYSNDDLRKLLNISLLNKNGIKISEIAQMTEKEISEKVLAINLVKTGHEDLIENLVVGMIDISESHFEKVISSCILRMGFENTVLQIIFPFLQRIGIMWQAGGINPAQEHFITNIIRQKLIVAIDSLPLVEGKNPRTALLFLPENELHELSLLFYNYAIKLRRIKTVYLGQSVPVDSLSRVLKIIKPDIVVSVITNKMSRSGIDSLIGCLSPISEKKKVLLSGITAYESKKYFPASFHFFKDLNDLLKQI